MSEVPVITVDGPGGTGKGTLCWALARDLRWRFLDSGALYRALAHKALEAGVPLDDADRLAGLARGLSVAFVPRPGSEEPATLVDGKDASEAIRTEACASAASRLAALPAVRDALLGLQRDFRHPPGLVADGRDMGTVVFPDAPLKLFLTASAEARAERRYKQLKEKGISVSLARLSADIAERDARDQERAVSPLKPARDAVVIDTTGLDKQEVRRQALRLVRDRFPDVPESLLS